VRPLPTSTNKVRPENLKKSEKKSAAVPTSFFFLFSVELPVEVEVEVEACLQGAPIFFKSESDVRLADTAHLFLFDHVPCCQIRRTFLIVRFMHSRLVLWDKHHQAHRVAERQSRMHSNGPIQRTKTHSPSCT
jgi:hypothetical protein